MTIQGHRVRAILSWGALLGVAAYVRLVWILCVAGGGTMRFFDPDALYHLRQIRYAADHFPLMALRDTYLGPAPGVVPWPGGFDWILAALLRIVRAFGLSGAYSEEFFLSLVVSLLGLGTVILAVFAARRLFGRPAGWIAGWLAALIPASVDYARFGRVDHHVLEPAVLLAGLMPGLRPRTRGLLLGLSLVISQSILVPLGIVAFGLFLSDPEESKKTAAWAFLTALVPVALSCLGHGVWFDYRTVSFFQVGLLLLWFLFSAATAASGRKRAVLGISALGMAALLLWPLRDSFSFLFRNPVVSLASETRPITRMGSLAFGYYTWNLFLWPIALVFFSFSRFAKNTWENHQRVRWVAAGVLAFPLFLLQNRFGILAAAMTAVFAGGLLGRFWTWGRTRYPAFVMFLLMVVWFGLSHQPFVRELVSPPCARNPGQEATCDLMTWFARNTPDPGRQGDPTVAPSYHVLAPWYLGHHLIYLAQRPALITPFIFDPATPGLEDSVRFYFLDGPEDGLKRLERNRIRYVIVPSLWTEAFKETRIFDPDAARKLSTRSGYAATLAARLWTEDLLETPGFSLRLIHEERWGKGKLRVFELSKTGSDSGQPGGAP